MSSPDSAPLPPPVPPTEGLGLPHPSAQLDQIAQSLDILVGLMQPVSPNRPSVDDQRFTFVPAAEHTPVTRVNAKTISIPDPAPKIPRPIMPPGVTEVAGQLLPLDTLTPPSLTLGAIPTEKPALIGLRKAVLNLRLRAADRTIAKAMEGGEVNRESAFVARGELPLVIADPSLQPVTRLERRASSRAHRLSGAVGDATARQAQLQYLWGERGRPGYDENSRTPFEDQVRTAGLTRRGQKTAAKQVGLHGRLERDRLAGTANLTAMEMTGVPSAKHLNKVIGTQGKRQRLADRVDTLTAIQQRDRQAAQETAAAKTEARADRLRSRAGALAQEASLHDRGLTATGEVANRYLGVRARIKRIKAQGLTRRAATLDQLSAAQRSTRNMRDRDTVITPQTAANSIDTTGRRTHLVGLEMKDIRERLTDWSIRRLETGSTKLQQRASSGQRRFYVPIATSRTVPAHVRKRYADMAGRRSQAAQRAAGRAATRRQPRP